MDKINIDNLNYQKELILSSLYKFYCDDKKENILLNMKKLLPILLGKSKISIRLIDWFVTNYSKKYNIIYNLTNNKLEPNYFNVYLDYKSQLKGYRKKLFDPFCRKKRITFYYVNNKCIITTIGQLNFFKWAISNNILEYIENHYDAISDDMNKNCKYSDKSKSNDTTSDKLNTDYNVITTKKERHELSESATKSLNCYNMKVIISFDI